MSNTELAQLALFSLERAEQLRLLGNAQVENDLALPADLASAAEKYVEHAWRILKTRGAGYDPKAHARALAEEAIIAYVGHRLMGRSPLGMQDFELSMRAWVRIAARSDIS